MLQLIELSHLNFLRYKKTYRICTISIVISTFMILFFLSLFEGCNYIIDNEMQRHHEFKEVTILPQSSFSEDSFSKNKKLFLAKDIQSLEKSDDVQSVTIIYRTSSGISQCFIDNVEVASPDYVTGIDINYDTFSQAEIDSYSTGEKSFLSIIAGRDFIEGDKKCALIDENSVYMYGVKNPEEIINHTIKIEMDNGNTCEVKIIGVYSYQLGINPLSENSFDSKYYTEDGKLDVSAESILVSSDVIFNLNDKLESNGIDNYSAILVSASDISSTINLFQKISAKYSNQVVCDTEAINNTLEYLKLFSNIFVFLGILLFLLTGFNLYSIIVLTAEKRKKWFALQATIGFRKNQLLICYIFEITFVILKGFIISLISILLVCVTLNFVIMDIYGGFIINKGIIFYPPLKVSISLSAFMILFIIGISFIISSRISKIDLIKTLCKE